MSEMMMLYGAALAWGMLVGLVYFGGLWLTVRRLPLVERQGVWMLSSFFARNLFAAAAFYPVVLRGWKPTLACLVGMLVVRGLLRRRLKERLTIGDGG